MKKYITPQIFGQMVILSENIANIENLRHKKKRAKNQITETFKKLTKAIILPEDEEAVFQNWDVLDVKYFKDIQLSSIVYICRKTLRKLLNNYEFNNYYYNMFKSIEHNSILFEKAFDFDFNKFEIDLSKLTKKIEML